MNSHFSKRSRTLLILGGITLSIKLFSLQSSWVEKYYSTGVFKFISILFRTINGWIPFSLGDLFYLLVIFWIIRSIIRFTRRLFKSQLKKQWFIDGFFRVIRIVLIVYIIFNCFWGINYNRKHVSEQLGLQVLRTDTGYLLTIEQLLLQKVNAGKRYLIDHHSIYPGNSELFRRAEACYKSASLQYPFLIYHSYSVKPSLFSWFGNYFGFTGYYNPFSGEAQVNTTVPRFIIPYTTCHEIAHQLGYAKEEEANFAGYLAATSSNDTLFQYSTYLDLFIYANRSLFLKDSTSARLVVEQLLPEVKADIKEWREFLIRHKNPFEPVIRWAYGNYLRANQQPKGLNSYDQVIADLIGFYKKYGKI